MPLPHPNVTPIPNTSPDAVPALWNTRYTEIDENFVNHENRITLSEAELAAARGGADSLAMRVNAIAADVQGVNPDTTNALTFLALKAETDAGLALREIHKTLNQRMQTGTVTIRNTGVIKGCDVTPGGTGRLTNITEGVVYIGGIIYGISAQENTASVAQNTGGFVGFVELYIDSTGDLKATNLNQNSPAGTMTLYRVEVPAGNTAENLTGCIFTKVTTAQPEFPAMVTALPVAAVTLPYNLDSTQYSVELEIVSYAGAAQQVGEVRAINKTTTGFGIQFNGTADNVVVNWTARKFNL